MANTIAYTSSAAPTGSLKSGVISINLNDQIIGQNYNWRNGIVFSNQYIIYSDTYTQGIDTEANAKPCAWACDYNDTALLNLINSLPPRLGQTPYTSLSDAITWLQGQNKYFIVNQNYPTITTDGLTFLFDPGMTASYPVTNTTIYDISGSGNSGSLVNGPVYNNSGSTSYFAFDGTDDRIVVPNNASLNFGTGPFTIIVWVSSPYNLSANRITIQKGSGGGWSDGQGWKVTSGNGAGDLSWYWVVGNGSTHVEVPPANTFSKSNDTYPMGMFAIMRNSNNTIDRFWNGVYNQNFTSLVGDVSSSSDLWIGDGYSENSIYGNMAKVLTYNKALSQSELLQNYYLGPIVTSGLVASYDSGNVVSYPGFSTTWYDIKGGDNGTLNNGVYYTINEGGILNFDGTDDYAQTSTTLGNLGSGDWTFSVWWKANGAQSDYTSLISQGFTGGISSGAWALKVKNSSVQNFISFSYASAFETITDVVTSTNANDGNWHNIVVKRSVNTCTLYMDGQSVGTFNVSSGFVFGTGAVTYIGYTPRDSAYILGNLGIIQKYTRALTDGEIIQNYGVYRNRFETNQAFATGGVVSTVIENGVRYRVHTFTSSGTLTVTNAGKMEVLCVAGGGAGGYLHGGGGGGAGGVIYNPDYSVTTGGKTITIGAGGVGGFQLPTNGSNSVMDTLTAIGGGAGGSEAGPTPGANGGSGGGGSGYSTVQQGGTGTSGQGGSGGKGGFPDTSGVYGSGGGGGGARQDGGNGKEGINVLGSAGNGGNGLGVNMTGTTTYYGGGGGGGYWGDDITQYGVGGLGGGGNGGAGTGPLGPNNLYPTDGQTNTGGGGGGSRGDGSISRIGASGGSGIVIVRYRI